MRTNTPLWVLPLLQISAIALFGCHKQVSGKTAADCTVRSADDYRWKLLGGECCWGVACGKGRADGFPPGTDEKHATSISNYLSYSGEFQRGYFHGNGHLVYANRDEYRGQFKAGKREGRGTFSRPNNAYRYDGQWKDDRKHGRGVETWGDGRKYAGSFLEDGYHGHGTMSYRDGSVYRGAWQQGRRHGQGTMTFSDGRVVRGRWILGRPARRIVGELGKQAYACSRDEDCVPVRLPVCVSGGCSPPCGGVYDLALSALNKRLRGEYLRRLKQLEQDKCRGIDCPTCASPDPRLPELAGYRAVCEERSCTLAW